VKVVVALKFLGFQTKYGGSHALIPCKGVKTFGFCERCLPLLLSLFYQAKNEVEDKRMLTTFTSFCIEENKIAVEDSLQGCLHKFEFFF